MPETADPRAPRGYRLPPAPIPEILRTPPLPSLSLSPGRERIALFHRESLPAIAELATPELRLAGLRIDPRTSGPSRETFYTGLSLMEVRDGTERTVVLPEGTRLAYPRWSPDGSRLAFAHATEAGLELWLVEISERRVRNLTGPVLNAALGVPFAWLPDGSGLLVKRVPALRGAPPVAPAVPVGPLVQDHQGTEAPARTYQDLLATPHDEALFEHHLTAELALVPLAGEEPRPLGAPGIFGDFSPAPGGDFLLVERIVRPYSYLVPWYRFPAEVEVWSAAGELVRRVASLPLAETVPIAFDAVPAGPRGFQWRADAPATLVWVEALDGGDPRVEAAERDRVLLLDAPFSADPRPLLTLEHRFSGVLWGTDEVALVYSRWWNTRRQRTYLTSPARDESRPRLLWDRSSEDRYGDPGTPVLRRNAAGLSVLLLPPEGGHVYLAGEGASQRGDYPFLDRMALDGGATERLWQAEDPYYESVVTLLDADASRLLTRRESQADPPNYFVRDLRGGTLRPLTRFGDPAPQLAGIQRELITYARPDGVQLSATLFTPPRYDAARDGPLPMLMWAYPREFLDAGAAGQVDDSPNRFSRPGGASHLFLLTQGYAVLDGPAMPIVGGEGEEPNDRYMEQLVAGARAAVEKVVEMGVGDRERIGIGGHSYGAFMTANLLAHCDLFRAGIARSGAYNRTLTPFGFQQEQRTYWEATEVYHQMSPFAYAHRIKRPILLIHGEADENSGTFPLQTERFFHALKGHGATVRYVVLPHEGHAYRALESVLHVLAEMVEWMDRYVKGD